ncbi:Maf family protein [Avibacterium paragallinarum]|uniref:dTTP/UTP pyrophosphatase n=1 Tax=Avibacterium paragallinarum TaxID=728 RepID=A0A0F5EWY8_AVIPA|nr:Maf family protein [Avibacterium paragallinarum]KAA6208331.1 septum formation inhibitor Maf [Avibacterium paragallinarum]KKB00905.1 septum formation inhibitor Maf [Avibacterium paragallinarum]RZN59933.1 septum formation inhibitor Maf [Avibacterium paragallinarum]RZN69308.1 septum formation inhibitor Maf [Avibacterium paragallinarum]TID28230.1 septum formation inhibitor Maf [Avibacterium paragallinarum]
MSNPQLYLASQSPRRLQLLQQLGLCVATFNADIDETPKIDELPADYVARMACEKNHAARQALQNQPNFLPHLPILSADTIVVCDQQILGKPQTTLHAQQMLEQLSARTHQVLTAVCVSLEERQAVMVQSSDVTFKPLTLQEIQAYIATGEPMDKAGAYGIQGLGGIFISHIEGSFTGIMGLPIFETATLLRQMGVTILS